MGLCIDKGFSHKFATEVLKDHPENIEALKILTKPKYRISINGKHKYFATEEEMNSYLNGSETKVLCEITIKDILGKNHTYRCCGVSKSDAEINLLKEFPSDKVIKSEVLYKYED